MIDRRTVRYSVAAALVFAASVVGSVQTIAAPGSPGWSSLPARLIKDVAVDSRGVLYVVNQNGTVGVSTDHRTFSVILPPPPLLPIGRDGERISHEAARIAIAPNDVPWAIITEIVRARSRETNAIFIKRQTNRLYQYQDRQWVERVNAPEPADVTVAAGGVNNAGEVFVTSVNAPFAIFYTADLNGASRFQPVSETSNFTRVSAGDNKVWAVNRAGTLCEVVQARGNWILNTKGRGVSDVGLFDVGSRPLSKIVGLSDKFLPDSRLGKRRGGSFWFSSDFGLSFRKDMRAAQFTSIAVGKDNALFAIWNGGLWERDSSAPLLPTPSRNTPETC